jgi:biofilm PGA synthesis N-glycosyltransferase PgaC
VKISARDILEEKLASAPKPRPFESTLLSLRWWLGKKQLLGPPPALDVSIMVPAHNEERSLAATITAILDQDYGRIKQVIVIDDCSTDGTRAVAETFAGDPRIQIVTTQRNMGTKARAMNAAMDLVTGDVLVTIDGDTILERDAISRALPYFNNPRTGAVCGYVVPQFSQTIWERGRLLEYLYAFTIIKSAQEHLTSILVASGCFTLFDFRLVKRYGGFEERTWGEDMDMTWRILEDGFDVRFASDAVCRVVDPPNYATLSRQITRWSHGFLQNIKVRHFNLFRPNPKLGLVAYFYLLWQFIGPLWLPFTVWFVVADPVRASLWLAAFYAAIIVGPGVYRGYRLGFPPRLVIRSVIPLFIIQFVNIYYFGKAVWNEWIRGVSLTHWEKGH